MWIQGLEDDEIQEQNHHSGQLQSPIYTYLTECTYECKWICSC